MHRYQRNACLARPESRSGVLVRFPQCLTSRPGCLPHRTKKCQAAPTDVLSKQPAKPRSSYSRVQEVRGRDREPLLPTAADVANNRSSSMDGTTIDEEEEVGNGLGAKIAELKQQAWGLFFPPGYPQSTSSDYLDYQLWAVPTHITGVLSHSLVTATMLGAAGFSSSPVGTVAAAASIKWIIKDGVGAIGRFFVGGALGPEFDDDPRRWRMIAEVVSTLGLALEVATAARPEYFLLLASAGNFAKAVGHGMGKPVHRVIQTHLAAANNVGAVGAKEEVWEVCAQLAGYACSVAALERLSDAKSWVSIVVMWAVVQAAHFALRYRSLRTLVFNTLNHKRAVMLALSSVRGQPLPTVPQLNEDEPMLAAANSLGPCLVLGASMREAFGGGLPSSATMQRYLDRYASERYMLMWRDGTARIVLKEGSNSVDLLRAMWQATWLHCYSGCLTQDTSLHSHGDVATAGLGGQQELMSGVSSSGAVGKQRNGSIDSSNSPDFGGSRGYSGADVISSSQTSSSSSNTGSSSSSSSSQDNLGSNGSQGRSSGSYSNGNSNGGHGGHYAFGPLPSGYSLPEAERLEAASLTAMQERFSGFVEEANKLGWKTDLLQMKVGEVRIAVDMS